jgi:hypothetical protein
LFTRCFRSHKSPSSSVSCRPLVDKKSADDVRPISFVIDAIEHIGQLVETSDTIDGKQYGDSSVGSATINTEQIEEMLVKWTQIARYLIETYQQVQQQSVEHAQRAHHAS